MFTSERPHYSLALFSSFIYTSTFSKTIEQAICLQKLQAVVITFLLFNFLEEYIIVKLTLTTFTNFLELYWKCACVNWLRKSDFFQDAFTKCVHIWMFMDI